MYLISFYHVFIFSLNFCFPRCDVALASMTQTSNPEGVRAERTPQSAMAEVLGQKSLLGFGVVLVWLVLFHLLVNIWLLCVFTSLLVVLGGWLGSQAVLESNSVVHLERFIKLEQVSSQCICAFRHTWILRNTWNCLVSMKKPLLLP